MSQRLSRLLVALVLRGLTLGVAAAQTGSATAPLSGVVIDQNDAVVPGVTVVVKNNGTGVSLAQVLTNRAGLFSVAALDPGTFTVTFSLPGFKTAVVNDVRIVTATPADLRITLEAGSVTETVDVHAGSIVVQTQSTTIPRPFFRSDQEPAAQHQGRAGLRHAAAGRDRFLPGRQQPGRSGESREPARVSVQLVGRT